MGTKKMQNIKLDLPLNAEVLARAATFLKGCADDMAYKPVKTAPVRDEDMAEASLLDEGKDESTTTTAASEERNTETGDDLEDVAGITTQENSDESSTTEGSLFDTASDVNPLLSIPHDKRIHSSGKTRYASNSGAGKAKDQWIYKRGTTPETAAEIEAELIAGMTGGTVSSDSLQTANLNEAGPATAAETEVADKAFGNTGAVSTGLAPVKNPPPNTEARNITNFPELMQLIHELKAAGKVDDDGLNAKALDVAGVPSIALMVTKMDFIPALGVALQAL